MRQTHRVSTRLKSTTNQGLGRRGRRKQRRDWRQTALMKTFILLPLMIFIAVTALAQETDGRNMALFRLGVSAPTFGGLNRNDTAAALLAWSRAIIKEKDLNLRPEMTVFTQYADLRNALLQDRLDAVTLSVEEMMMLGVTPGVVFLPAMEEGIDVRYAIIVHGAAGVHAPASLTGRKIAMHDSSRMTLALPWLETLIADAPDEGQRSSAAPQIAELVNVENPSKAVFQVYFQQADAALVTTRAFELACELNPQLRKELKVLAASPPFIISVLMFRPSYQGEHRDELEAAINVLHTTAGGRQLLTTFQCSRMERHPLSVLDDTKAFLAGYRRWRENATAMERQP